jgi:uncharacterized membrane protein YvbJ
MRCPKCQNENNYDALTCEYCMAPLPMTKEREKDIKRRHHQEKKAAMHDSMVRLAGLLIGLGILIGIVVVVALIRS